MSRKVETCPMWAETLGNILQQQRAPAPTRNEGSSLYSASDHGVDVMQEFVTFSDYYGRDIFEAAKLMVLLRLAIYWTHRARSAMDGIEKTRYIPVAGYANVIKAGWMLQRLHGDARSRSDECTAVLVSLSEVRAPCPAMGVS